MKTPPTVDISYRPLYEIAMGPLKAALMNRAIDLTVFDELTEDQSFEEVSRKIESDAGNTRRLLDALTTLNLLRKKNGRYRNRPIANTFLVSESPAYIGPLLKQAQDQRLAPLDRLKQLIKHGPPKVGAQMDMADESIWAEEAESSAGWAFGGVGQLVSGIISELQGFSNFEKMMDMGCGHGVFSLYILNEHPTLRTVLLDRPAVLKAAECFFGEYEALDRATFLPADYMTDDIRDDEENGYDLVFACATLNFAIDRLDSLVSKIHESLKPGGYFVSFHDGMIHERTRPDTMLGAVVPAMMSGADYCFQQGMIAETAIDCGFRSVRSRTVSTSAGDIDIDIARKAG
jgi:SAM-dependent methyltransferase